MTNEGKTPPVSGQPSASGRKAGESKAGSLARAGIQQARRKANDVIAVTKEKGEAVIEDTREKTFRAAAETNRLFQEHPVAAVAAAAAAGAILAIFVPQLAIAGKAGSAAGKAGKAAKNAVMSVAASDAAKQMLTSLVGGGNTSLPGAVSNAAIAMGKRVYNRRKEAEPERDEES